VAVLAVAAAIVIPLSLGRPQSAMAVARQAASIAISGTGLPPFALTVVTTTAPAGFQPEPPPPRVIEHIDYAGPSHWRTESVITEPFREGTQTVTQIRGGSRIATVAAGRVTVARATGHGGPPFSVAWPGVALRELLAAGSAGTCARHAWLSGNGPLIDGRPTVILRLGPSPCPSADVPQANGSATFWLDQQTLLLLRADLHGPGTRLAETIQVTALRYHATFPAGTFRVPRPSPPPTRCPTSLPNLAALRRALAAPPLLPASLPGGLRTGPISPTGTTLGSPCKLTTFTVTYLDPAGHPAVQLYEAPQASPAVRFPGRTVTIRPGLTGTLTAGRGPAFLWWIQDGRYCALQTGGLTAGVRLARVPPAILLRIAAAFRR
jgi:hypothetical protein